MAQVELSPVSLPVVSLTRDRFMGLVHRPAWRLILLASEAGLGALMLVLVVGGVRSASRGTRHGGGFHPSGIALALGAEMVSLVAMAMIPRWLLASQRYRLRRRDAVAVALAANAISVAVPGGSVAAPVWAGGQYQRRGASTSASAWTVIAGGFISTVTLVLLLVVGLGTAGVLSPALTLGAALAALVVAGATLWLVRRAGLAAAVPSNLSGRRQRWGVELRRRAGEIAVGRAGWGRGGAVLGAGTVNWVADSIALVGAFVAFGLPVPWAGLLIAYGASQAAGALVPLPGGLGVVDGSLFGSLVAIGVAPHNAVAVVALYRIVGYWLPALAGLPAYVAVRRYGLPASSGPTRSAGARPWLCSRRLPGPTPARGVVTDASAERAAVAGRCRRTPRTDEERVSVSKSP
jgi:putative heme transporter